MSCSVKHPPESFLDLGDLAASNIPDFMELPLRKVKGWTCCCSTATITNSPLHCVMQPVSMIRKPGCRHNAMGTRRRQGEGGIRGSTPTYYAMKCACMIEFRADMSAWPHLGRGREPQYYLTGSLFLLEVKAH